ncbi:MAG: GTP-binding protein, partial [Promethearchaeota archaeon]
MCIYKETLLIFEKAFSKVIEKEAFETLINDFFTNEIEKIHYQDYKKYRITYYIEKDFKLLFLFVNDVKDDSITIKKELSKCKKKFLNYFKDVLPISTELNIFKKFDEIIFSIQDNLSPIVSLVGYNTVGKTTLFNLIRTKNIPLEHDSTITADIAKLKVGRVNFLIRDFTGQGEIGFLWNNFIKDSDLVLVITDSTPENVEKSKFFIKKIEEETPYANKIAIGNKWELENSIDSTEIENMLGIKTYSLSALNPNNRDEIIRIIIDNLEMHDEMSPILNTLENKELLLNEFENAIATINIEKLDYFYKKIIELCKDLGESPIEMEFYKKYHEIKNKLKDSESLKETFLPKISTTEPEKVPTRIGSLEQRLKTLLLNYINNAEGIIGVIISDREGFVITSESKKDTGDEEILGAIAVTVDSYIEKIKKEFSDVSNFFNITTIKEKKFAYCSMGSKSILLTISNLFTTDTELRVYSEHVASKIELLLEGNENISLEIPEIVKILSKTKDGKIPTGDYYFKLILTGDFAVGKTSLINRYVQNLFKEVYQSTIGVDITQKVIKLGEDTKIRFIIWDIGGQMPKMAPYRKRFYEGANFAFITVDRTRLDTLEDINAWYEEISKFAGPDTSRILIGNKSDLTEQIQITESDLKRIAD